MERLLHISVVTAHGQTKGRRKTMASKKATKKLKKVKKIAATKQLTRMFDPPIDPGLNS